MNLLLLKLRYQYLLVRHKATKSLIMSVQIDTSTLYKIPFIVLFDNEIK